MKKLLLALVYIITLINIDAQNAGYSAAYSFDIRKKFDPPILEYVGDVIFLDENDNNAIDANEKCAIEFTLLNTGKGDALNLITNLKATGNTDGIKFNNLTQVPPISKLNGKQTIKIEINSNGSTVNGVINFVVEVIEPNGFNTNAVNLQIITRKLLEPEVAVVDLYKI